MGWGCGMAEQTKQTTVERDDWELLQIRSLVRLAAFAVEAERVLRQIEDGASKDKNLNKLLGEWCDTRMQWVEYAGEVPNVLDAIHQRLGVMLDLEG